MAEPLQRLSLYDWIGSLPEGHHGEVIDGPLHVQRRPSGRHGLAASRLCTDPLNPYGRDRGGPGGWLIVIEPEVHFVRDTDFVVPDLGGWRRARMADVPDDQRFEVVPDWVCEILSPSTSGSSRPG